MHVVKKGNELYAYIAHGHVSSTSDTTIVTIPIGPGRKLAIDISDSAQLNRLFTLPEQSLADLTKELADKFDLQLDIPKKEFLLTQDEMHWALVWKIKQPI